MPIKITDDCINCGACLSECPVNAIHPKADNIICKEALFINNNTIYREFTSAEHYYADPNECNGCAGLPGGPKCNDICPVACCVEDPSSSNAVIFKEGNFFIKTISLN